MTTFRLFKEVVGGYSNIGCTTVDFKNFSRDLKAYVVGVDAQMMLDKMSKRHELCSTFTFDYEVNKDDQLRCVFWADPISRRNFSLFGDVVSFDATYRTNRYSMIFAPFTGKDNHGKLVTFGAALMSGEDAESYSWVFQKFKDCMGGSPSLIITDQDLGLKVAVRQVLPDTRHRLCIWHIMFKVPDKLPVHIRKNETFRKRLNNIVWSNCINITDFELIWKEIMVEFGLADDSWFKSLYDIREDWVPAYFRDLPMSGLCRTTSISESVNSFYSRFLRSKSNLVEFLMNFDSALDTQRDAHAYLDSVYESSIPKLKTPFTFVRNMLPLFILGISSTSQYLLNMLCLLNISTADPVVSDTPVVTVQVPLGEVSPAAAAENLVHDQGEDDVDISFLDEESPVNEDVSVLPPKATSSKTRGSKRKLELRDELVTPPVSDDEDDTPIAKLKSKVLVKVAAKKGSPSKTLKSKKVVAKKGPSSKPPKSVKPAVKKVVPKKFEVVPTHRITRSVFEQRMGLMSGRRRPLMKQARAPCPSDEEAEDVPESVPDRSDSDSEDFDSSKFISALHQNQSKIVAGCSLISERCLVKSDIEGTGVDSLLHDLRLEKSAYSAPPFIATVVHEFYANLSKRMCDASYEHAFSVFVRGHWFAFFPAVINDFLGHENFVAPAPVFDLNEVVSELTGRSRVVWPSGRALLASDLSVKYSILHKVVVRNWLPSTHDSTVGKSMALLLFTIGTRSEFNLGLLIFENIIAHAESTRTQPPVGYPGLIFSIIMAQHDVVSANDVYAPVAQPLSISHKLFSSQHAPDVSSRDADESSRPVPPSVPDRSAASFAVTSTRKQELEALLIDIRAQALGLASPLDVPSASSIPAADKSADVDADDDDDVAASQA
ncbi:hypothetical protein C2S52_017742 [Perilla frutescens var. hirtella]|nr:hypothetical protein C2S52_017742 [Perilla frutescens var. hirtella]